MPKLSVIVPVYKVREYIHKCLDSVVNQTFKDIEIILIDDGSPDECGTICDEYAAKDERIVVIHKKNAGVSAARNDGIEIAKGEWITFVDSDDWLDTDFYERLFTELGDQDVNILCSGGAYREDGTTPVTQMVNFTQFAIFENRQQIELLMAKALAPGVEIFPQTGARVASLGVVWDKLYRTDFLREKCYRFDSRFHPLEDNLFSLVALDRAGRVAVCPEIGYHYQILESSSTHGFKPSMPEMAYTVMDELYKYMTTTAASAVTDDALNVRAIMAIQLSLKCCYFHKENGKPYREIAREIQAMKQRPFYRRAIMDKSNRFYKRKQLVIKYLLRLPWVWPLKLIYEFKRFMGKV